MLSKMNNSMQGRKLREEEINPRRSNSSKGDILPPSSRLHKACWNMIEDDILACIRAGCNVNELDPDFVPMHYILRRIATVSIDTALACISALFSAGTDLNIPDQRNGCTPIFQLIHDTTFPQRKLILQLLVDNGGDINYARKTDGKTPIAIATELNDLEGVRILVEAGADVNVTDKERISPLHVACRLNKKDCIKLLVDAGADVNDDKIVAYMESGGVQFQLLTAYITRAINSLTMAAIGMDQLRTSIEGLENDQMIDNIANIVSNLSRTQDELRVRIDSGLHSQLEKYEDFQKKLDIFKSSVGKLDDIVMLNNSHKVIVHENLTLKNTVSSLVSQMTEIREQNEMLLSKVDKREKVILNIMTKLNNGIVPSESCNFAEQCISCAVM